jgi:hypothetical protein
MSEWVERYEVELAAWVRQYMRARHAGDEVATRLGRRCVIGCLSRLLSAHLESAVSWNSDERWIDGLVGAQFVAESTDRITVNGQMVWGMTADAGGPQWAEPFEADVHIDWEAQKLRKYSIRFGDHRELDAKRVKTGFYGTMADEKGEVVFRPFPSGDPSMPIRNVESEAVVWAHSFP